MYTRTACTQGKRKQIKYPPKLVRFTDHSPQVVLDRRRTPHSIYCSTEIIRQGEDGSIDRLCLLSARFRIAS
jgi:hypothetical protein